MFEKIKKLVSAKQEKTAAASKTASNDTDMSVAERERIIYGEDRISRQKLYEKWVSKDTWLLQRQGIPLLCGIDPEKYAEQDTESMQRLDELWQHARDCVQKKLLSVINTDIDEAQWEVVPADLYCWATVSRVSVPQELTALMDFVLQTVKVKPVGTAATPEQQDAGQDERYLQDREKTLGAAVSLLVNNPDVCKSRRGNVKARLIAEQIMKNADVWFGKEGPLLAQSAMEDLINRYIAESQVLVNLSGD